jgi:CheY-like chemotaxis protein
MRAATILVVDDEPLVLEVMTDVLATAGYSVMTARSGAEGIQLALNGEVDLIVMNYNMPGMSGLDAVRRLRDDRRTRSIPVALITGGSFSDLLLSPEHDILRTLGTTDPSRARAGLRRYQTNVVCDFGETPLPAAERHAASGHARRCRVQRLSTITGFESLLVAHHRGIWSLGLLLTSAASPAWSPPSWCCRCSLTLAEALRPGRTLDHVDVDRYHSAFVAVR